MKVLIAVDESECSELALKTMAERSWPADTIFRLVTVVEPLVPDVVSYQPPYVTPAFLEAEREYGESKRKMLNGKADKLREKLPYCTVEAVTLLGHVARTILQEAADWNADLLVLGSHGRRGFQKFFLGSVAETVASEAPCSVEIVKQKSVETVEKKPRTAKKKMHIIV
jgi:nucleotide-binding universal stress UspA family protein